MPPGTGADRKTRKVQNNPMDRKIAFGLHALGLYQILLGGVTARRGTVRFCCGLIRFDPICGARFSSRESHFVLDISRDDVLNCENYVMGRCA
jgi:hypothetical protein